MKKKLTILNSSASIVLIAALCTFAYTLVHALWYAPDSEIAMPMGASHIASTSTTYREATSSLPYRLIIPAVSVNAAVQYVGIKSNGNMATPSNFTDVGWYKYGTTPGQIGSAVMAGHVDNGLALAGVFKHLKDLKIGDDIYVQSKDGTRLHFVVSDIESYDYTSAPADTIFNAHEYPGLNLITCDGDWVQSGKTYDHRLVVYSRLVA
jgi:sortase A